MRPMFLGKYSRSTPASVSRCPQCRQVSSLACPFPSSWRRQVVQALCPQAGIMRGLLPSAKTFPQAQQFSSSLIPSNYKQDLSLKTTQRTLTALLLSVKKQMAEFQIYATSPKPASPRRASPDSLALSPTRYDADFYRRKAERLEQDILTMGDELNRARLRLRRAEDYEIKYDMLFRQKSSIQEETTRRDKELFELRAKNEELTLRLKERGERSVEGNREREDLLAEVALWRERATEAEERSRLAATEEQTRGGDRVEKELARMRRNFSEAQEEYKFQIARMGKQISERSSSDNSSFEKQERGRREKEAEIQRLERVVGQNREDFLAMVQEKNRQIDQLRNKFEQLFNAELGHLRQNMGHQDQRFSAELDGLRKLIEVKNAEIANLQEELRRALEDYTREREELNLEVRLLREKIYERERENEEELFNMKERLVSLHAIDIEALKAHYEALIQGLREERGQLETLLADRDNRVQFQLRQFERGRQELRGVIADRDRTIEQLRAAQTTHSTSSSSEANTMQASLAQLAGEKEAMHSEHQANTAFLNQQLSKLTASNELKNNEIRELHEYTALLKKEHFESLRELELKWKNERRDREAEREKERDLREKVEEEFRERERQWRNRQRELERDFEKERREKNKWNINNDKLQKEIERLFKENKQLQELLKSQMGRNQKTMIVSGDSKRELSNELQRQRAQLQTRKRLEVQQLRKQLDLEITRLTHLNQRLQNELTAKRIEHENLEEEFRKVNSQYKNVEKINKEKLADYHKKMATINSEILLTQNLYQSFIDAKSRVVKKEP